mmetsp:Transcript_29706/g.86570  ORF Transcript_29706/g.86570 Transcript_29706/m.86570 type:complete len:801 (+) Transcript_29706:3385-5787(+)|eukprot:CAMPEP_0181039310 /NCGR_PEP_ID=MMETSP1070-20121207/10402_1 /TAXON_ID=265543 /ORGANISM="Minutocellus polymorphus, Strain NH13" /LENGTH=800 /DNA_ID=CAMNT_0023117155 /DNA_START=73 /DNA_END=2475 /DNA_ORIENTATION=-
MGSKRRRRLIAGAVSLALLVPEGTSFQHPSASDSPLTPPPTRLSAATTDRALERPHKAAQRAYAKAASSPLVISNRRTNTQLQPIPVTGYNAREIAEYYDRRPWEVGWRLNSLSLPLLGWYIALLSDKVWSVDTREDIQQMRGAELRMHLVRSGSVALVKSGQALSLRPDLLKNKIWADELGKLVDAVGSFSDIEAMDIMRKELSDLLPKLKGSPTSSAFTGNGSSSNKKRSKSKQRLSKLEKMAENDPILSLFEFYNDNQAIASASIGQCYKARIKRGPRLEAAIGKAEAERWGGRIVAIKIQRPDAAASASLDMYLIRRAAEWLSKFRGGGLPAIADQFGMQLFGELDYQREANNCERFRELYGDWPDVFVPESSFALTRKKVLIQQWVDGEKGPWLGDEGIEMVRIGLRCSVDQLLHTGLFHADPHRGNLLKTKDGKLAVIDFGMMADVSEEERYGLIGLSIGIQNKDLPLITENLLKLGFLEDTTQIDILIPRLRTAVRAATGGTGKASDINFSSLQAELDAISRENVLKFKTPPFFTIIIRSLTILEGFALSVDPKFRLVRGAYPYVLRQLLSPDGEERTPESLRQLLIQLLTVDGKGQEIEWDRLRSLLLLAEKASKNYNPNEDNADDKRSVSRQTIELFIKFLTSKTGMFMKKPLVYELSEAIDGMASIGEANLLRISRGIIRPLPGGNGPVNERRMEELRAMLDVMQSALSSDSGEDGGTAQADRLESMMEFLRELIVYVSDDKRRVEFAPALEEVADVFQQVAVRVLEIRGSRAMRNILQLTPAMSSSSAE